MSYKVGHIDVWDTDGHFHQIFAAGTNPIIAKRIVNEVYPKYKKAELIIMTYDNNTHIHIDGKDKVIKL